MPSILTLLLFFILLFRCMIFSSFFFFFFFFNDTATTEIYTLSLHDALPISLGRLLGRHSSFCRIRVQRSDGIARRSEEHTSELQSPCNLVCRLLLEKKKKNSNNNEA